MKRSQINAAAREACEAFARHGWALPPNPRWDVTDFGLGDFDRIGLTVVNLAEEPEYCEKIMYVRAGQVTPRHHHQSKKEDIICRAGRLAVKFYGEGPRMRVRVNGQPKDVPVDRPLVLEAGERVTMTQGLEHSFWGEGGYAIVGEVSTRNDDMHDNYFDDRDIGRFSPIEEDEPAEVRLVSERGAEGS